MKRERRVGYGNEVIVRICPNYLNYQLKYYFILSPGLVWMLLIYAYDWLRFGSMNGNQLDQLFTQ